MQPMQVKKRAPAQPARPIRTSVPLARGERLRTRRRAAKKRILIALAVLLVLALGAGVYALWQPWARIQAVEASGPHADTIPIAAKEALAGTYFHLIPRDSIFFYPRDAVRTAVLDAYPDIEAVSLSRTTFKSVSITAIERATAFTWCGEDHTAPSTDGCYDADNDGFIFESFMPSSIAASTTASDTPAMPSLPVYAALAASSTKPLRATVANAPGIVGVIRFARAMGSLGARVKSIQIRDDEADLYTSGGTRITYVIGQESAAASLAATAFPELDLNGGSLDYIDLRFSGKVYYKPKGGE
ncbi:MAG TPA: hypothetical protein VHC20_03085 [Candidatus Paceibacterota bacterium]|nr:hypothetical protein [Candidatus Paceibacterota bacterium]